MIGPGKDRSVADGILAIGLLLAALLLAVGGSLNSRPNQKFKIRFFSNSPGGSEGEKYIGAKNVATDANGNTGAFSFKPENKVPAVRTITATATRTSTGDTSEFSATEEVVAQ